MDFRRGVQMFAMSVQNDRNEAESLMKQIFNICCKRQIPVDIFESCVNALSSQNIIISMKDLINKLKNVPNKKTFINNYIVGIKNTRRCGIDSSVSKYILFLTSVERWCK